MNLISVAAKLASEATGEGVAINAICFCVCIATPAIPLVTFATPSFAIFLQFIKVVNVEIGYNYLSNLSL